MAMIHEQHIKQQQECCPNLLNFAFPRLYLLIYSLAVTNRLKNSGQQFIAVCCALIFQLSVFASLVHAAEHPFHVEQDSCAAFINFTKHDVSFAVIPAAIEVLRFAIATDSSFLESVACRAIPCWHSRAPPHHC
jgi:hypothetical protein